MPICSTPPDHNHHHRACGSHPEWCAAHQVPNGWQLRAGAQRPAAENQRVRLDRAMQPRSPTFPPVDGPLDASDSQPPAHYEKLHPSEHNYDAMHPIDDRGPRSSAATASAHVSQTRRACHHLWPQPPPRRRFPNRARLFSTRPPRRRSRPSVGPWRPRRSLDGGLARRNRPWPRRRRPPPRGGRAGRRRARAPPRPRPSLIRRCRARGRRAPGAAVAAAAAAAAVA